MDDGWKLVEVKPETIAVNGNGANGNGHHDAIGPTVELVPGNDRPTRPRSRSRRCSPGRSSMARSR